MLWLWRINGPKSSYLRANVFLLMGQCLPDYVNVDNYLIELKTHTHTNPVYRHAHEFLRLYLYDQLFKGSDIFNDIIDYVKYVHVCDAISILKYQKCHEILTKSRQRKGGGPTPKLVFNLSAVYCVCVHETTKKLCLFSCRPLNINVKALHISVSFKAWNHDSDKTFTNIENRCAHNRLLLTILSRPGSVQSFVNCLDISVRHFVDATSVRLIIHFHLCSKYQRF